MLSHDVTVKRTFQSQCIINMIHCRFTISVRINGHFTMSQSRVMIQQFLQYNIYLLLFLVIISKRFSQYPNIYLLYCTCFGSTYTKIGTIQRRLAWPLRKDDTQNREAFHIFVSAIFQRTCLTIKQKYHIFYLT